jgi:hypothetical protein
MLTDTTHEATPAESDYRRCLNLAAMLLEHGGNIESPGFRQLCTLAKIPPAVIAEALADFNTNTNR